MTVLYMVLYLILDRFFSLKEYFVFDFSPLMNSFIYIET